MILSLGICFSGGGIKGAAHIGVLKAFEEVKINFDYISLKDNKVSVKITAIKDTDMTVLIFKEKISEKLWAAIILVTISSIILSFSGKGKILFFCNRNGLFETKV